MKPIPFLTEEEIQKLQEAEANSSKEQKKTAEQIRSYLHFWPKYPGLSVGWFWERPLSWQSAFWTNWRVVSKFLNSLSQPLPSRLRLNSKNAWRKISQQIQESDDVDLKQHLGRQLADLPKHPSEPWTLLHKNSLVNMATY